MGCRLKAPIAYSHGGFFMDTKIAGIIPASRPNLMTRTVPAHLAFTDQSAPSPHSGQPQGRKTACQ